MHVDNLDLLRKEAIRLVDIESKVLDEVINVPKLVDEDLLDSKKASLGNRDNAVSSNNCNPFTRRANHLAAP